MCLQRRISWNAALRDLRDYLARIVPGVVSTRSLIQSLARVRGTRLASPTGVFDRATIMVAAVEAAKSYQLRTGAT